MAQQISRTTTCCDAQKRARALDVRMREANHRIANSLQTVIAITGGGPRVIDADGLRARDLMLSRISAVANVHRLLSVSTTQEMIDFGGYLEELVLELQTLWADRTGARAISCCHSGDRVSAEIAAKLGMIVNELVTNSCKYAYDDRSSGEVRIGFSIEGGAYFLLVADDGGRTVLDPSPRRGCGQRLLHDIAASIGASLEFKEARPGTIAILTGAAETLLAKGNGGSRRS